MAETLTPQQHQAVTDRGGKLLVSAAAGSGKTKVLVDRLMSYLTDPVDPANIDEFLIITFTKAAAAELRGKIASKLSERIAQEPENRHLQRQLQRLYMTTISTVHSFCGDVLRQFAYRLDLSADFRVADDNECNQLQDAAMSQILEEAYRSADENPDFRSFIDTQGVGRDDREVPEILLRVYNSAQCHIDPEGWLDNCLRAATTQGCSDASHTLWGEYLIKELFDYLDLQIEALERCLVMAENSERMEGPVERLKDTLSQLRYLRESQTWDDIVKRKNIEYGTLKFSPKVTDLQLVEGIKAVRNACKKGLPSYLKVFTDRSDSVLEDLKSSVAAVRGMLSLVKQFSDRYAELKDRRRILDFSDLEHKTLDLLYGAGRTGPTAIAYEIGSRFREVMVDEYQDSNEVQDAIYSVLTQRKQNCFMVGDVKQSIYQFRLADPGLFLKKYNDYLPASEAKDGQGRKVILSKNFRSCGAVLSAANSVFRICMSPRIGGLNYSQEEALHEGLPHEPLNEPEVEFYAVDVQEETYPEEAMFVAQRIAELLDGKHYVRSATGMRPIVPDDIVILLRSPKTTGAYFEDALAQKGIRCSSGGGGNLLKAKEIMVVRSLLQTIYNPQQDIPLVATLVSPVFCFTADDLASIRGQHFNRSLFDAMKVSDLDKGQRFVELLSLFRSEARVKTLTELLETIYVQTQIDSVYSTMEGGEERRQNLQTFYQLAVDFEAGGHRDLGRFLEYLDSLESKGQISGAEPSGSGCVTIMTIHKSKGLEFPVVFLCSLSRAFSRKSQEGQVLCDKELGIGTAAIDSKRRIRYPTISKRAIISKIVSDGISEELRILYVAMTRAKDRLIMTYASRSLETELTTLVARMNMECDDILARDANCLGRWVLMAALRRTEAGALFAIGGNCKFAELGDYPWKINVVQPEPDLGESVATEQKAEPNEKMLKLMEQGLRYQYPYKAASEAPSKQTATQRKGRVKDQEASQNAQEPKPYYRSWRKPTFAADGKIKTEPVAYGKAIHAVLQYIDLQNCADVTAVEKEVFALLREGVITAEQAEMVDCGKLADFFATPLGQKVRHSGEVLREFKFSILDDGTSYDQQLYGEKILLQGVVDCAIIEDDGITIIDFKTDRINEEQLQSAVDSYRTQVEIYAEALERIFCKKVKRACLYFFQLNHFVDIVW